MIGADGDDVAASIGFTAVLGVAVVLGLPLLGLGHLATALDASHPGAGGNQPVHPNHSLLALLIT